MATELSLHAEEEEEDEASAAAAPFKMAMAMSVEVGEGEGPLEGVMDRVTEGEGLTDKLPVPDLERVCDADKDGDVETDGTVTVAVALSDIEGLVL